MILRFKSVFSVPIFHIKLQYGVLVWLGSCFSWLENFSDIFCFLQNVASKVCVCGWWTAEKERWMPANIKLMRHSPFFVHQIITKRTLQTAHNFWPAIAWFKEKCDSELTSIIYISKLDTNIFLSSCLLWNRWYKRVSWDLFIEYQYVSHSHLFIQFCLVWLVVVKCSALMSQCQFIYIKKYILEGGLVWLLFFWFEKIRDTLH